ncbi:helix-turn-helix domain-containing protein [Streptomyces sp. NBC_01511]|uniref:helix-turn-helix domain-containing protein n=1 Tax=Streptomyces sp. NBC_01511 TaxID=2903889 RepID=UPI003863D3C6
MSRGAIVVATVLDTTCSLPGEATAAWEETTALASVTQRFRFPRPESFGARIRAVELGDAQLSEISCAPLVSYRSSRLIRQSDPESYQFAVITSGWQGLEQAGHRTSQKPGGILLFDSSRPFEAFADASGQAAGSLLLQFPRKLMPLPDRVVAPLCGMSLKGAAGIRQVFRHTLGTLVGTEAELTDGDRARLSATVVDLAAALIAGHAEQESLLSPQSRTAATHHELLAFIRRNLHDPDLKPALIAEAHCLSVRTLHRVFQAYGSTVGDVIRSERLSRCRRDLAEPALRDRPVSATGARWGFPEPAAFTRAFHAAYGMPPTEYRRLALEGGDASR